MNSNLFLKQIIGALVFFSLIFISAGHIYYWQGIIYVSIGILMLILSYTALRIDPELMQERSKPGEGAKKWDKSILGLSLLATLGMYITAGLDSGRYHWSPPFHNYTYFTGAILTLSGQVIFLIAQKQNKFFSSTVRIQTERNHTVCDSGLYKLVRHPAYMGSLIQTIGFPMLFGSLWSIIPVCALMLMLLIRTYLEDKTLINELQGYKDYAKKIKYRLIPFVW